MPELCVWSGQAVVGGQFPEADDGKRRCACGGTPKIADDIIADHAAGKAKP